MLGADWLPVAPVEEFLEYLRAQRRSPNTVRNYAQGLARWWEFLGLEDAGWEAVSVEQLAGFLVWLRSGETTSGGAAGRATSAAGGGDGRTAAGGGDGVFVAYHQLNGVAGAGRLYEDLLHEPWVVHRPGSGGQSPPRASIASASRAPNCLATPSAAPARSLAPTRPLDVDRPLTGRAQATSSVPSAPSSPRSKSSTHDELAALNAALIAAHGELLELRRRLASRAA